MTINSLLVTDFQSIKKAKVEFSSKSSGGSVTTFVGPSSTGKSALLRALKMLMRNTSSVPVRIQEGAAKTTVTADVDGTPIRIERGKSLSTYFIGTEKYSKAGTSVPQPVQDVLKLDDSAVELHTSTQFDKPYLLDESGTTVSAIIGKLTHANTLRLSVKEGNRRSLEAGRLLKTRLTDLEKAREQLVDYAWVDKSAQDVVESQKLIKSYKDLNTRMSVVGTAISTYQRATEKYTEASQNVAEHPDVSPEVEAADSLLQRCVKAYSVLTMIEDKKFFAQKLLSKKTVTLDDSEVHVLESHYEKIKTVSQLVESIACGLEDYKAINVKLTKAKESSEHVQEVYTDALHTLGICPTCGKAVCK